MGKKVWFRAFVERLLMAQFDTRELVVDVDGDVPFHDETAACWVSIETRPALAVRVWGIAADGIRPTAAALREVNDLNQRAGLAKVTLGAGRVVVEVRLPADQVSARSLSRACGHVVGMADDVGVLFAGVFGGSTPFSAAVEAG
ncbi:MAG TPA: YbjN domain-containing protein [Pedococcus sp.]